MTPEPNNKRERKQAQTDVADILCDEMIPNLFHDADQRAWIRLPSDDHFDPSSTVWKIRLLSLNDLRKAQRALALHFRHGSDYGISRKVGGRATPVARTACEACAVS
jgi:hypothetical protein